MKLIKIVLLYVLYLIAVVSITGLIVSLLLAGDYTFDEYQSDSHQLYLQDADSTEKRNPFILQEKQRVLDRQWFIQQEVNKMKEDRRREEFEEWFEE